MKPHKGIDFSECISQPQFPWIPALRPASVKMGRGSGRNDDLKAFTLDPSPDQLTAPVSRVAPESPALWGHVWVIVRSH